MELKTKSMQRIYEPIEEQMKELQKVLEPDNVDVSGVTFGLHEQIRNLAEKLVSLCKEDINDYKEMNDKMTTLVHEFCASIDIKKLKIVDNQNNKDDAINFLLSKFIITLQKLESLEYLPLKQNLQDCYDYIKEMGTVSEIEDFQNIKELGTSILDVFKPLQHYKNNLISKLLNEKLSLYLCQLCAAFNVLVQLIQEQHRLKAPIFSCKKYVCDRLCYCFKMIIEIMDMQNPTPEEEVFEKENHFVYRMDLVLDIITNMMGRSQKEQSDDFKDLWSGIEDVFAHAMAIAQVCDPLNFKAISGVCQSIMSEYENLKVQITNETPEPTMINLFLNSLIDALYRLERKVNISVLTLIMEVFSDPFGPLRKLVKICGTCLSVQKRSVSDLSEATEEFDQLSDKAIQIGNFAIACCRDINRVNKIRNSLASLESLGMELIPAISDFYLHPDNKEKRASVKLLTDQWQSEINQFHTTVFLIIDSSAYCQVVLDDIQERVTIMSNCLDNREGVTQRQVQGIVNIALTLVNQLSVTMDDLGKDHFDRHTIMKIRELKASIYEADHAAKTLLLENSTEPQQLRVIKRCEMVLNVIKTLQPILLTIMNNSILMNTVYENPSMGQGDTINSSSVPMDQKSLVYIRTPYTVSSFKQPLSIQPANSVSKNPTDLNSLIPYIKRGRNMRSEQSIMYKTPKRCEDLKNELKMRNLSSVRQHLFSRDSFTNSDSIDLTTESLDLTGILDQVTGLLDTFSTSQSCFSNQHNATEEKETTEEETTNFAHETQNFAENIVVNFNNQLSLLKDALINKRQECSTVGGGDAPSTIETPERLKDLTNLEKKLEALKAKNAK